LYSQKSKKKEKQAKADGNALSNFDISEGTQKRLISRGITSLFPIQVCTPILSLASL
jgi:hypothetical protein